MHRLKLLQVLSSHKAVFLSLLQQLPPHCYCELFTGLFGHWMMSASKVDTASYLPFCVLAPRSMLWPLDGE